jgi:hypothetical protein
MDVAPADPFSVDRLRSIRRPIERRPARVCRSEGSRLCAHQYGPWRGDALESRPYDRTRTRDGSDRGEQVSERGFERMAAAASALVGALMLLYGLVFLFVLTPGDKRGGSAALAAYAAAPLGRDVAQTLLAVGGMAALPAVVAVYARLRDRSLGWATLSVGLGGAMAILTALHAVHSLFLLRAARRLADTGDTALEAAAVALLNAPSPADPSSFGRYFIAGVWLLVTGALMVRSRVFPDRLGWLAAAAGVGSLLFFLGQVFGVPVLSFATGLAGSAVVGPVFWVWLGVVLWRQADRPGPVTI